MYIACFTLCTVSLIMSTLHVLLDFDLLIMFTALHVALETRVKLMTALCICVYPHHINMFI